MAKFYGKIGFVITEENPEGSGIWKTNTTERAYAGDMNRKVRRWDTTNQVNEDININNELSIIADPFAYQNIGWIRYVEYMGFKWKVTSIENTNYPRLVLSLGGVYNG